MAKKVPLLHIEKGIFLQVDGEEEKNNTLSWDILKQIGDNTQTLINKIARYSLTDSTLNLDSLKLDFVGFFPGSAIPKFKIKEPSQTTIYPVDNDIQKINSDFTFVISHLNDGNFQAIADRYTESSIKNDFIDAVSDFSNSAGTKPFRIVRPIRNSMKFAPLAKIRFIEPGIKKMLKVAEAESELINKTEIDAVEGVSKVVVKTNPSGRKTTKLAKVYTLKEAALSLRFDSIETDTKIYSLKTEMLFSINESKKYCSRENEMLDIYASGQNQAEAEQDLFEQFDYTYQRLNNIDDDKLSKHLQNAKQYINLIVDIVKDK